ncbi:armadillo repeat-containing protein 6 isoform X1 [Punica granatum]|uniref:Uncharacterized protein n=2 Tax=Punica granatum TaxID=22663 RepID=A0A2I0I5J2_PUNGR|nr:armadillo repeat-containing protein 6 isoform X1 [Punica granatum]PKI39269.1 hypothetical protein CRG98_040325 [Punica granatum]
MGPPSKGVRTISQEAFEDLVRENMEDLGMEPAEAIQDAIDALTLQGVDLSGIVMCLPGEGGVKDNPIIQCLERLKQLDRDCKNQMDEGVHDELVESLDKLTHLCSESDLGNAAIATRNGGVEVVCSVCSKIPENCDKVLVSSLRALGPLLHDTQSQELFKNCGGPRILLHILDESQNSDVLNSGFTLVAAAATGNEILKESFMELKIGELIMLVLSKQGRLRIQSLYDAIRVLLTADDNRVVASQVYGYARKFAKVGIAGALVDSLHEGLSSPTLISASIALKSMAVNDEICKYIAENGGIDALLQGIDHSGEQGNKTAARVCCSLLSKLAGSDANKNAIVEKGGMNRLIKLSARFSDDPSVLQEVMSIISVLCLRSPENAARAIEAGAGDLALQAMEKFPAALRMQRSSCLMIRNLVVRNAENRALLLGNGIEKYIRMAKQNHDSCKDAATDALRDLGLDNYNS